MERTILGIDVSKATIDVALLRPNQRAQAASYHNTPAGFKKLGKWLTKRQAEQVHVCLEATGTYGDDVALFLHEAGHTVSVVNPVRIKKYAESLLQRNKTDQLDAAIIADFCLKQQPPAWTPPDPAQRELRALTRHLLALKDMRQQERNRLQSGITSETVRETLNAHITFIQHQIDDLEQQIHDHIDQHPDLKQKHELLDGIPGIGPLTAASLLGELPDLSRFDHSGHVVAFAGLNPRQHRSGSSVRGQTRLSKTGNAILRRVLYFPALSAKKHNPLIAPWCAQLLARGKT
ncbi:IS110 family transposase, partial [Chloroflexota bacterium]